ncbi:hypothetical protein BGZ89_012293 [Linnemannia elongata]|nr:hypothetical protein BGZ89_012293 [Linnemannia elongata]
MAEYANFDGADLLDVECEPAICQIMEAYDMPKDEELQTAFFGADFPSSAQFYCGQVQQYYGGCPAGFREPLDNDFEFIAAVGVNGLSSLIGSKIITKEHVATIACLEVYSRDLTLDPHGKFSPPPPAYPQQRPVRYKGNGAELHEISCDWNSKLQLHCYGFDLRGRGRLWTRSLSQDGFDGLDQDLSASPVSRGELQKLFCFAQVRSHFSNPHTYRPWRIALRGLHASQAVPVTTLRFLWWFMESSSYS